jgi:hypothetical protein
MRPSNGSRSVSGRAIVSLVALLMGCTVSSTVPGDAGPQGPVGPQGPQGVPGVPCVGCVTSASIAPGAVGKLQLADGGVTAAAIAAGAVTSSAIAAGAVGPTQLAAGAVTGASIDPTTSITATNFVFASPKTARFIVQAYGFAPQDNTTTWSGDVFANGLRYMTGGTLQMAAPIHFPDGAALTNLTARMYDGVNNAHVTIYLRRFDGFFPRPTTTIAQVGTTDAETPGFVTRSIALTHAVDNSSNSAYFLVWEEAPAGTGIGGLLVLYSAEVDYTYTSP